MNTASNFGTIVSGRSNSEQSMTHFQMAQVVNEFYVGRMGLAARLERS